MLVLLLISLIFIGSITAVIDPFFHYHGPLDSLQYPLDGSLARYLNDGIIQHFSYDAVITGTCMSENFLVSECNSLMDVNAVKVPFAGASFGELNNNIRKMLAANHDLKFILCSIDEGRLFQDPDYMRYECPTYLYDKNPFNDVQYVLSKEVLCEHAAKVLLRTYAGIPTTSFDEYCFWGNDEWNLPGRENALNSYERQATASEETALSDALQLRLIQNLTEHTIQIAKENPDTHFIYFFPPYSILHWDQLNRSGTLKKEIETFRLASKLLTEVDNIHLFAFYTEYGVITDLDNYANQLNYSPEINSMILQSIAEGRNMLTSETYVQYWQEVETFYAHYDYDALFSEVPQ